MDIAHKIDEEGRRSGCPFGHNCNTCNLYRPLYKEVQGGDVIQEFDCAWNNLVALQSETKNRVLAVQQSVESSRNESTKRQDRLLNIVGEQHASLPRQ